MPQFDINEVNQAVKDSAYAAVGFGVLGFQRAQVRRRELTEAIPAQLFAISDRLSTQAAQLAKAAPALGAREQLVELARLVDERVQPARRELQVRVDELESRLPEAPRQAVHTLRQVAQSQEATLRSVVGL
ncbi:MAG: hypothetical protein ACRDXE_04780 [Acidimicrobiales bacterium]